jgi:hypothetical protein
VPGRIELTESAEGKETERDSANKEPSRDKYCDRLAEVIKQTQQDVKEVLKDHPMLIQAAVSGHFVFYCPRHRVVMGVHPQDIKKRKPSSRWSGVGVGRKAWFCGDGARVSYCKQSNWHTCFPRGNDKSKNQIFPFPKEPDIGATFGAALALTDKKGWRKNK